jgi:hypothetical protein
MERVMKTMVAALSLVLCAGVVRAQKPAIAPAQNVENAAAIESEIGSLKAAGVAWRKIAWKTCLLEGLEESRASRKPVLLWVFIDRPSDDARC